MIKKLDVGDFFPRLELTLVGGGRMGLPDQMDNRYRIVLFYRGHW